VTLNPHEEPQLVLSGQRLFSDPWTEIHPPAILIDQGSGRILATGDDALAVASPTASRKHFPREVLFPALIDCHVHLLLDADGAPGETTVDCSDAALLERAMRNAGEAVRAGTTTVADQGGRPPVIFNAREGARLHPHTHAYVLAAGCPITTPREHMWYFRGEASGIPAVQALAQEMLDSGADLLKIVATGGGTEGSNEFTPTFEEPEIQAAVDAAHQANRIAAAHASSREGIRRALEVGCDVIHHCNFYRPDGIREFDPYLAERLAERNVSVDPTLWVSESLIAKFRDSLSTGDRNVRDALDRLEERFAGKLVDISGLIAAGVRLIAGSDAGWQFVQFSDACREVQSLARAGLPSKEALAAATKHAAEALKMASDIGTLTKGAWADVIVLTSDPAPDLTVLAQPVAVFHQGRLVRSTEGTRV